MKVIAAACLLLAGSAFAQSSAPVWAEEPTTFLGIALGVPYAEQKELVPCPTTPSGYVDYDYKGFCVEMPFRANYRNEPFLGFPYSLQLIGVSGGINSPEFVMVRLPRAHASTAIKLLIDKYGKPTQTDTSTAQNSYGGRVSGTDLTWQGKNVEVSFVHAGGSLSESVIMVTTKLWRDTEAARTAPGAVKNNL